MCAIPELCMMPDFVLRGPILAEPEGGWKIRALPTIARHLQPIWDALPSTGTGAKPSWWAMLEFLNANGFKSAELTREVVSEGKLQWCSPDPSRCRGLNGVPSRPYLPWAAAAWENANNLLADGAEDPGQILQDIVVSLTTQIGGPLGCTHCAVHWAQVMAAHPIPVSPTLDEARRWLVDRHNDTREGRIAVPFTDIVLKFNWTLS